MDRAAFFDCDPRKDTMPLKARLEALAMTPL